MLVPRYLCIDPSFSGGTPPDVLLTRSFYTGVRWAVKSDQWSYVGHCLELGINVALVIDKDSGDPSRYFDWATSFWMIPHITWFIGNEMTSVGPSSWNMDPLEYHDLWASARGLRGQRWIGGVADGDPNVLWPYHQWDAAGISVHIYTLDPYASSQKINEYFDLFRARIWIGETHPADKLKMADYLWPPSAFAVNDFCYSEAMVQGMGLFT